MSIEEDRLLEQTLRRLLSTRCEPAAVRDSADGWLPDVWAAMVEVGVPGLGIAPECGGSGGTVETAALAVRIAAEHAAPVPIAETVLLGNWLAAEAGLDIAESVPCSFAVHPLDLHRGPNGLRVSGVVDEAPWAVVSQHLVALAGSQVVVLPTGTAELGRGSNLAGEPRNRVVFDGVEPLAAAPFALGPDLLVARGAAARVIQIAGAADRVLELCVEHAKTREQFGKRIGDFQAVGHLLARAAGAAVATQGAAQVAVQALEQNDIALAGSAKVVASEAAGTLAQLAHQVHGAIGMTREHSLHLFTRRLWAWRDEYGGARYWALRCGRAAREAPSDTWAHLVGAS